MFDHDSAFSEDDIVGGRLRQADLLLVGTGIDPLLHLTPEAREALSVARCVYHLTAAGPYLATLNDNVIDWREWYLGSAGTEIYQAMAERLIEDARAQPVVALAIYGHPLILVDTSQMVIDRGMQEGLRVEVVAGVSSLDVLLQHLLLDVGLAGLQVYEANQMVLYKKYPRPDVACFVMQVGAFGTKQLTKARPNHPERFVGLRDFLLERYSTTHPAVLITCPFMPGLPLIRHDVRVGELGDLSDLIHTGMTLYLPPAPPSVVDEAFLHALEKSTNSVFAE